MLVALHSRPIADDWSYLARVPRLSPGTWFQSSWLHRSDRVSAFVLEWLAVKLLGPHAVNALPIVLELSLCALAASGLRAAARATGRPIGPGDPGAALVITVALIGSAPSPFDTAGWFANVAIYLAATTAAAAVVSLWVPTAAAGRRPRHRTWAGLLIAGCVAAGFDEIVGTVLVLASAFALSDRSRRRAAHGDGVALAIGAGAAVGTLVDVIGPGSRQRALEQHAHVDPLAALHTAAHNLGFLLQVLTHGAAALAVSAALLIWTAIGQLSADVRRSLIRWAAFLVLVPWLVVSALTTWGGSLESGGRSPFRVAFLISGPTALAITMIALALISRFPRTLTRARTVALSAILAALGSALLAPGVAATVTAEQMRARALAQRERVVRNQLAEHRRVIVLNPAPLLSVATQAYDLSFAPVEQQRAWVVALLREYYAIPSANRLQIVARQPRAYCLPGVSAPWVGVQSCQELHAHG